MLTTIRTVKREVPVCVRNRERGDQQASQWDGRVVVVTGGCVIGHGDTAEKALIKAQIFLDNQDADRVQ